MTSDAVARVRVQDVPASEHPLETAWTFWYDKRSTDRQESDAYASGLKQLGTFATVEDFYRHYSHMQRPSDLPYGVNVHCFRKGYKPMWEEFPDGGCWILRVKKKASRNYLNFMWESLLMACVGEDFEIPDVSAASCRRGSRTTSSRSGTTATRTTRPASRSA